MRYYLSSKYNNILSNFNNKRSRVIETVAGPPYDLLFSTEIQNFLDSITTETKTNLKKNLKNEIEPTPQKC
jgi:hypothetical protein